MKTYIILPLVLLLALITGCSQEYQLQKSVFINDVNNPGLPEYSEWGYNTFGIYIDREAFVSTQTDLPAKIIVNVDTFNFLLRGRWKYQDVTLKFSIRGYSPTDYPDLISLNDSTFNLTSNRILVTYTDQTGETKLNVLEGELFFKRVQKLYVDKVLTESILSGT